MAKKKKAKKQATARPSRKTGAEKTSKQRTRRQADLVSANDLSALTELIGDARTIIHVHGIGNKPEPSVLKCQWDHALFGFELGERSRMCYWVNRDRYPKPKKATCADQDDALTDEAAPGAAIAAFAEGLEEPPIEAEAKALAKNKNQQDTLVRLARKIERAAEATHPGEAGDLRASYVESKILPVPRGVRKWLTRRVTRLFIRDSYDYFYNAEQREAMLDSVRERLRPGGGPFVVIGHSQGSMIAYHVLSSFKASDLDVRLFLTLGSPLGITEVKDQIERLTKQRSLKVPACVSSWVNVAHLLDPVALDKTLKNDFSPNRDGVSVDDWTIRDIAGLRDPHGATMYLRSRPARTAVRNAVAIELFQPVADFVVARDLAEHLEDGTADYRHDVLIQVAEAKTDGTEQTLIEKRNKIEAWIRAKTPARRHGQDENDPVQLDLMERYIAARLTRSETERLAAEFGESHQIVHRVWRNMEKRALMYQSTMTIQSQPAVAGYRASGEQIRWAVLDTGVNPEHPHFEPYENIIGQTDCTKTGPPIELALNTISDNNGHGTHVAGIIAGAMTVKHNGQDQEVAGVAPRTKLHIYKVLRDDGIGSDSFIIKALDHIASLNSAAGRLVIHGVNLSLGGPFDRSAFGCGHSPLCVELRRLWRQGVMVVIACGNEGYAVLASSSGPVEANMDLSISDPANLEEAIAVGSVHRDRPHTYGISYFSSRGPTADGRQKPDLVAPGERIYSCRHRFVANAATLSQLYVRLSGTSMAAPHVSGVLAGFLSVRQEFIGHPDRVKRILLENCTDLDRDAPHQGAGMPNLVQMLLRT